MTSQNLFTWDVVNGEIIYRIESDQNIAEYKVVLINDHEVYFAVLIKL